MLQEPNVVAPAHQYGAQHDDPSGRGLVSGHCPGDRSYHLHHAEARLVGSLPVADICVQGMDLKISEGKLRLGFVNHNGNQSKYYNPNF